MRILMSSRGTLPFSYQPTPCIFLSQHSVPQTREAPARRSPIIQDGGNEAAPQREGGGGGLGGWSAAV